MLAHQLPMPEHTFPGTVVHIFFSQPSSLFAGHPSGPWALQRVCQNFPAVSPPPVLLGLLAPRGWAACTFHPSGPSPVLPTHQLHPISPVAEPRAVHGPVHRDSLLLYHGVQGTIRLTLPRGLLSSEDGHARWSLRSRVGRGGCEECSAPNPRLFPAVFSLSTLVTNPPLKQMTQTPNRPKGHKLLSVTSTQK